MSEPKPVYTEVQNSDCSDFAVAPFAGDETAVAAWALAYPVAHRVYWTMRAALDEADGGNRPHHHRVAVLCIHDAFGSKPERTRLGLPATALELAALLGVTDRVLRKYRRKYSSVFETTRYTLRQAFIGGYYGRVFEALGETAATQGRDGAADRRLFMQLAGDLVERVDATSKGEKLEGVVVYLPDNGRDGGDDADD